MTISLQENLNQINSLINYIRSTDAKIKFEEDHYAGSAGGAAVAINIIVTNANDVKDTFSTVSQVSVSVSANGVLSESNPITIVNGQATIHVSDVLAETVTLSLTSGSATLDVSHTSDILFS